VFKDNSSFAENNVTQSRDKDKDIKLDKDLERFSV
jgi:hypothetical protein